MFTAAWITDIHGSSNTKGNADAVCHKALDFIVVWFILFLSCVCVCVHTWGWTCVCVCRCQCAWVFVQQGLRLILGITLYDISLDTELICWVGPIASMLGEAPLPSQLELQGCCHDHPTFPSPQYLDSCLNHWVISPAPVDVVLEVWRG